MRPASIVARLALLIACGSWAWAPAAAAEVYFVQGYHGGYYLTGESEYRQALDKLFDLLDGHPQFKVVFEVEPYTLERMKGGERFACEKFRRDKPVPAGWALGGSGDHEASVDAGAARSGRWGVHLVFRGGAFAQALASLPAEKLRGRTLVFSGWIRQHKGRGAHLYVDAWDQAQYLPGSSGRTARVPDDGQWHRVEMRWDVPEKALRMLPQAKCDGEPTEADFDDLSLKEAQTGEELLPCGDFERAAPPGLRDEARLEKLRQLIRRGQLEVVGGAYTQPIFYAVGDESALRQFVYGTRAVEAALGVPVQIYAAQEPGLCPQLPPVLRQAGIERALYRTLWCIFGSPPHRNSESVVWAGGDGTGVAAIPSYEVFPLPRYSLVSQPSPAWVARLSGAGIQRPLFVTLDDFLAETVPAPDSPIVRQEFGQGWANVCRRVAAGPFRGKDVLLSCAIRARLPGAHMYIDSHDEQGKALRGVQSENVAPDGQWHRVQLRYRVPESAVWLFPQGRMSGTSGDADFDALKLTAAGGGAIAAASFETGDLEGFGVGTSDGVRAQHGIVSGGAAEGEKFVALRMQAPEVKARIVTLAEYFQAIGPPAPPWPDAFKGFEFRFPYGLLAGEVQRRDRESENLLLGTERLLAIAGVDAKGRLDDAWQAHLMGEHHDGWVCAPVVFGIWKQPTYAEMCKSAFDEAGAICRALLKDAGGAERDEAGRARVSGAEFAVVNPSGWARRETVPVRATLPRGAAGTPAVARASAPGKAVPAEVRVLSKHEDGSAREIEAVLLAEVPATGAERYRLADGPSADLPPIKVSGGGSPEVDNGKVRLIASREGVRIARKGADALPLLLAGYFPGKGDLKVPLPATEVRREGGSAWASGEGRIGGVPFKAAFKIDPDAPLVRMRLEFDFGEKTEVGAQEDLNDKGLPAHARDDRKLRLVVPLAAAHPKFFAHAAFEIRAVDEERFPVLRYAAADGEAGGIAVFTDRATMGLFHADPAAMEFVLAYGGRFLYAPREQAPLAGKQVFEFGLLPYDGGYRTARLAQWSEVFSQPLLVVNSIRRLPGARSLVALEPEDGAVITALALEGKRLVIRLWQPLDGQTETRVRIAGGARLTATDLLQRRREPQADVVRLRQHQFITLGADVGD